MPRDPLEPVYRLIASSRFNEAINHINKVLKKQPNFLIAKVWKCEALYGLGNIAESEELMNRILEQAPSDKRTLECIAEHYRARADYNKLVEVYENALKIYPNDETWRKALFECCGLAGDYKKQHQQALILYKQDKQNKKMLFYCMAVVCLLQQADENPVALELAERMMTTKADAGELKFKHDILLLLTVLEMRKKYEEALTIVEKSSSELESLMSIIDKKIELYLLMERWQDAYFLIKQRIESMPDSWVHYQQYIKTVLQIEVSGVSPDDPNIDCTAERAIQFLKSQHNKYPTLRGPLLAQLELYQMYKSSDCLHEGCGDLISLIVNYFEIFGVKGISVYDLQKYIPLVPESEKSELLKRLSVPSWPQIDALELQQHLGPAKHVTFVQLSRLLGVHASLTSDEKVKLCTDLTRCYASSGDDERRDYYLAMMAHIRLNLYEETGDGGHLVTAIYHLEEASARGPGLFALQVLLLQLYFSLGATKVARKIYEQLRIQSVQVDTLAHMFLTKISSTGHFSIALEMWETALKIINQCLAESVEALFWSYRSGLFHRVNELTRCARRFQLTINVPLLREEKAFLELVVSEPSRSEQVLSRGRAPVKWDSCLDNRDLKALPTWDPLEADHNRSESFRELLRYSQLRAATFNAVAAAVTYGKDRKAENKATFTSSLDDMRKLFVEASTHNGVHKSCSPATRLQLIVQKPLPVLLEKLLDFDQSSYEKACAMLNQMSKDSMETIVNNKSKDPRKSLEVAVTQIEALTIATLVCGAVRTGQQSAQKRRSEMVVKCLENCWALLEGSLNFSVPSTTYPQGSVRESVEEKLINNYQLAVEEMKKVLRFVSSGVNWRQLRGLPIIHSNGYVCELPPKHRFPMKKFNMIIEILISDQVVDRNLQVLEPQPVTIEEARTVHSATYVNKFFAGQTTYEEQRVTGFEWSEGLVNRVRLETGGTVLASKVASDRGLACSTGGGTHHAFPDRGAGFCLINDIAVAARLSKCRVLIVDLDVHQGDGSAFIFRNDPNVFTFSMHAEKNFPFRKEKSDLDVALPNGMGDDAYMTLLQDHLDTVLSQFRPDLLLYDAGVDPHEDDELGKLSLTDKGLFKRDVYVINKALERGIPVAAVIGGGYSSDLFALARRHSILHRAATHVWRNRGL